MRKEKKGNKKMKNVKINVKIIHEVKFIREMKNGMYVHDLFVAYDEYADIPYVVMSKTPKGKYYSHEKFYCESDAIQCMMDMIHSIANFTMNDMIEGK